MNPYQSPVETETDDSKQMQYALRFFPYGLAILLETAVTLLMLWIYWRS